MKHPFLYINVVTEPRQALLSLGKSRGEYFEHRTKSVPVLGAGHGNTEVQDQQNLEHQNSIVLKMLMRRSEEISPQLVLSVVLWRTPLFFTY